MMSYSRIVAGRMAMVAAVIVLCAPRMVEAQSRESAADRCSWEGWLPPSAGRARVRARAALNAESLNAIRERVRSADKVERELAVERLSASDDPQSIAMLVELTRDPSPQIQDAALRSLGRIGATRALPAVVSASASADPHVRQGAIWALGQLQDSRGLEAVLTASRDTSKHIRNEGAWALGLIGGVRATDRLIELAADPNEHVRLAVACSLDRSQGDRIAAARTLSGLTRDNDSLVREAARWARERIRP